MNDKIRKLMLQSGYAAPELAERANKLAELIVKECIQVVDSMADPEEDSDRYVWAIYNASLKIKQHFGVDFTNKNFEK